MIEKTSGPPTREQLLTTRKRIVSVAQGKKLLERKRDALIRSVEEEHRLFREVETEFLKRTKEIYFLYTLVRMFEGEGSIRAISSVDSPLSICVEKKIIMGCRYSSFHPLEEKKSFSWKLPFDPAVTSLYVEELLKALSDSEESMWKYINLKTKIGAITRELSRTTLRINTLEHVFLPSLLRERKKIEGVLSERERQEKFVSKRAGRKKRNSFKENTVKRLDTRYENHYS